jgi:hypothetical protein
VSQSGAKWVWSGAKMETKSQIALIANGSWSPDHDNRGYATSSNQCQYLDKCSLQALLLVEQEQHDEK